MAAFLSAWSFTRVVSLSFTDFEGGRPFVTRGLFIEGEEKKKTCPKASVRLFLSLRACYLSQRGEVGCISAQGPGEESRVLFWRNVIRRYRVAAADSLCGVSVRCALPPREFVVTKKSIAGIGEDLSSGRVTQLSYLRRR